MQEFWQWLKIKHIEVNKNQQETLKIMSLWWYNDVITLSEG